MRQGLYTGRLYEEDHAFSTVTECCRCLTDEQVNDEEYLNKQHMSDLMNCLRCMGCPTAQEGIITA